MKKLITICTFLTASMAQANTGGELLTLMDSNSHVDNAFAIGLVAGASYYGNQFTNNICLPPNVPAGQLQAIVKQYLMANPRDHHLGATFNVNKAVSTAFPCKK
jgi:hypothetical protein